MDIFYRGFDSGSPISSGAKHLTAAAARLLVSMIRSIKYLDDAALAAFLKVVTINNVWALSLILAGWLLASLIGGPVGAAVNAILLYIGLREIYSRISEIYEPLKSWILGAYEATNDAMLDEAGKSFAVGLANGVLTILEFIVLHRIFRAAEAALSKRFPRPEWLQATWDRAVGERTQRKPASTTTEPKPSDPTKKTAAQRAEEALPVITGGLQTKGAIRAADAAFPVAPVVAAGAGVLVVAGLAVAALGSSKAR